MKAEVVIFLPSGETTLPNNTTHKYIIKGCFFTCSRAKGIFYRAQRKGRLYSVDDKTICGLEIKAVLSAGFYFYSGSGGHTFFLTPSILKTDKYKKCC